MLVVISLNPQWLKLGRNATRDGAKRGMTMTLDRIQNSSSTRRKVGI
jgi:hypothetical protein